MQHFLSLIYKVLNFSLCERLIVVIVKTIMLIVETMVITILFLRMFRCSELIEVYWGVTWLTPQRLHLSTVVQWWSSWSRSSSSSGLSSTSLSSSSSPSPSACSAATLIIWPQHRGWRKATTVSGHMKGYYISVWDIVHNMRHSTFSTFQSNPFINILNSQCKPFHNIFRAL